MKTVYGSISIPLVRAIEFALDDALLEGRMQDAAELTGALFAMRGEAMDLKNKIEDLFSYHAPEGDQPQRYINIRTAAKALASVIVDNTPASADQTAAIRKLRECVMTANAAIALKGLS